MTKLINKLKLAALIAAISLLSGKIFTTDAQQTFVFTARDGYMLTDDDVILTLGDNEDFDFANTPFKADINAVAVSSTILCFYHLVSLSSNNLTTICDYAFSAFTDVGIYFYLQEVNFPNVTEMGCSAFHNCTALSSINIPKVTDIKEDAFYGCNSLQEINIPEVNYIGEFAFYKCSSLRNVICPNVITIEEYAFNTCTFLQEINCPNAITVGEYAFEGCTSLHTINFPLVEELSFRVFQDCTSLKTITSPFEKLLTIERSTFNGCVSLENINGKFPVVKTIDNNAFYNCNSERFLGTQSGFEVIDLDMPEVTSIGNYAFGNCTHLSLGLLENQLSNLAYIGRRAFFNCPFVTGVGLPQIQEIGEEAFLRTHCKNAIIGTGFTEPTTIFVGNNPFPSHLSKTLNIGKNVRPFYYKDNDTGACMWNGIEWDLIGVIGETAPCGKLIEQEWEMIELYGTEESANNWVLDAKRKRDEYLRNNINEQYDNPIGISVGKPQKLRADNTGTLKIEPETFKNDGIIAYITSSMETNIGNSVFENCFFLQEINFPIIGCDGIGANAFKNCYFLRKVTLGTSYTEPVTITLSDNSSEYRSFEKTDSIDLVIGDYVLPRPEGMNWNGYKWKSINHQVGIDSELGIRNYELRVFPNPTKGELRVESGELRVENVEIFDISGHSISPAGGGRGWISAGGGRGCISPSGGGQGEDSSIPNEITLDISHLPNGIYFLRVNGKTVKIIKN